ncbi:MAG TPA: amino acid adenylation domain-containing protein [Pyrinomonadaceae bacterium]|nr:amino acid adenylation domain-containing protein [Pyrinomonadaceae bacterium]
MQEHFSNPTTEPGLAHISDAKRALLQKYLRGEVDDDLISSRSIARRFSASAPQLSFAQERLWFLDQLMPGSPVFNVPIAVRLSTPIDLGALQRSLAEIVSRHEVFRTTFTTVEGKPEPVISADLDLKLAVIDLTVRLDSERETEARRLIKEEALRPFDLACGPLIRAGLIQLSEQESIFLLTMHHIISDGWSIVLFFQELSALHRAFASGQTAPLAGLPIQYADYAAWQREWLRGEVLERQLSYWKNQLSGELPVLELPTDRPRPAMQTHPGARAGLTLSRELSQAVIALSQREGVTLFMTLLAGFKVLLHHYTAQDDIIVGSPIANRPRAETEKLIGFFLNNLALRTDLSGDPGFRELLSRVRKTSLDAYANQDVPFEKLIEELKPERDLSRSAIFQVYFNLFSFSDEIELPGTPPQTISFVDAWLYSEENQSKFDLTLYAGLQDDTLKVAFVYNSDLFEESSVARMLETLRNLLTAVVADPERAISDYALSDKAEISIAKNDIRPANAFTRFERSEIEQPITKRFEAQVGTYPARIAVKTRNHDWSYAELNAKANQIAHSILKLFGDSEARIALLFEHDAPMIAGMLGVLKAGKTYVPLDPSYPVERLSHLLRDSQAVALVTNEKNLEFGRKLTGVSVLNIDSFDSTTPSSDPNLETDPGSLAYILYTSGSTSQPKGVMQNHRNVLHFIRAYTNNLHINTGDRLTLLSSYCFDAAVMDIYAALLNGATLYPIDIKEDGLSALSETLVEGQITIYHSTPTVYRHFVSEMKDRGEFPHLRLVVLGGEEVTRGDVELFKQNFSDACLLVNGLGPTESTVSLQYFIDKHTAISGGRVPVGYPVDDTEVFLLNRLGKRSEIYGEIAIKSQHVALGYWRNDEATELAFGDPAASVRGISPTVREGSNGCRVYRTGDMGRRLPDGSIVFAGRRDLQVKIRGVRVEPGEIESALAKLPGVRECAVIATANGSSDRRLVAYVVPRLAESIDASDLRRCLQGKLPDYMVPSAFVVLDGLPLTSSGKLNRRALPAPEISDRKAELTGTAPRTPTEKLLTEIWSDLLGVAHIGTHENFFDLGGHSLLAVRLFAQVERRFGKPWPLATLFQAPTIAQFAAMIEKEWSPKWSSLVAIKPNGSKPPFFCVHGLGGNVLEFSDLARHLDDDQPFYGLQSQGLDGTQPLLSKVEDMAAHYIKEMRELQPEGPYLIGGRSLGGTIAFEMARQLQAAGQEIGLLALLDTYPVQSAHLARRLSDHLTNLRSLSLRERFGYLAHKARFAPRKIKSRIWRTIYNSLQKFGWNLPRALHSVTEFNSLAAHRYVPRAYDGKVTLFWASGDLRASNDLVEGWRALATGGIEVREIPGTHLDIIKEPHVAELANKLSERLERAQNKAL